jgi:RNA polymerase sigma factor (sigma-70 family)
MRQLKTIDSESQLVEQLLDGCPRAMEKMIELYGQRLRRTIGQLTAWCPDVDDLLQETLVRAWKHAGHYRADGPLEKWLVSIAFRVCRDHQRGLRRVLARLNRLWLDRQSPTSPKPLNETERWDQLQQAMAKLSPTDRQLLVLKYLEDWPIEELAGQFDLSIETLHVRLHRARFRLKQLVQPDE